MYLYHYQTNLSYIFQVIRIIPCRSLLFSTVFNRNVKLEIELYQNTIDHYESQNYLTYLLRVTQQTNKSVYFCFATFND